MDSQERGLGALGVAIEDADQLDAAASALQDAAEALTSNEGVKSALTGEATGSPLHPALVHLPIGGAVGAVVLDLLDEDRNHRAVSQLTGLVVASALPSAVTGLADLAAKTGVRVRRTGAAHAGVNLAGTVLAAASWATRAGGGTALPRLLLWGAVGAYGVGGFLGGRLAAAPDDDAGDGPEL